MKAIVRFDRVFKKLNKLPYYIVVKAYKWAKDIEEIGIQETRKLPGYHDEPLKGHRAGERSVRLSKNYRLFYVVIEGHVLILEVMEINKHEY